MITTWLLAATLAIAGQSKPNLFDVQTELQALYDEITDGAAQFMTAKDVDLFHDVLYASDSVFIDTSGQVHQWQEMRARQIAALGVAPPDSSIHSIQKVTLVPEGAQVLVTLTTVRTIVDTAGRYGHAGASHTLTEITPFRDQWVRVSGAWKLKSRAQTAATRVVVDKHDRGL